MSTQKQIFILYGCVPSHAWGTKYVTAKARVLTAVCTWTSEFMGMLYKSCINTYLAVKKLSKLSAIVLFWLINFFCLLKVLWHRWVWEGNVFKENRKVLHWKWRTCCFIRRNTVNKRRILWNVSSIYRQLRCDTEEIWLWKRVSSRLRKNK